MKSHNFCKFYELWKTPVPACGVVKHFVMRTAGFLVAHARALHVLPVLVRCASHGIVLVVTSTGTGILVVCVDLRKGK